MKTKKALISSLLICLIVITISTAVVSPQNAIATGNKPHQGATGTMYGRSTGNSGGSITPNIISHGNFGTAEFVCWGIGSGLMDADWTLRSSKGNITFVNAQVTFDNGTTQTFRRSCFSSKQQDVAQSHYSTLGYHTADFSASGTILFEFSFWTNILEDGDMVY